jgi:hypothetical protein
MEKKGFCLCVYFTHKAQQERKKHPNDLLFLHRLPAGRQWVNKHKGRKEMNAVLRTVAVVNSYVMWWFSYTCK